MKDIRKHPFINGFKFRAVCPVDVHKLVTRLPTALGVIISMDTDDYACKAVLRVKWR